MFHGEETYRKWGKQSDTKLATAVRPRPEFIAEFIIIVQVTNKQAILHHIVSY